MSTAQHSREPIAEIVVREPLERRAGWIERFRSADHKVIGTTMIGFSLVVLVVAGVSELLTWIQLALEENTFLTPERFYTLHSLSDTSYLYLFALPLLAGLATYVLPLQIGARSTAFPRLSALGCWMIVFGGAMLWGSLFVNAWQGGVNTTSALTTNFFSPAAGADFWLVALTMIGGGLTFNAIDLAVTYKNMRAPGMTGELTPPFAYAAAVFAYGILVTAPVLAAACIMMLFERQYEIVGIFDPAEGGNALLWKALYQWFAHSAPYLATVLAIGIITEILTVASGAPLLNRPAYKKALALFAALSILGFGRVFFGSPVAIGWEYLFMLAGLAIAIPAAVIVFGWVQTVTAGAGRPGTPALLATFYVVIFTFAVVATLAMSLPTLGSWLGGSQFGYALWHTLVFGAGGIAGLAGLLHWFPKITGRSFAPGSARLGAILLIVGSTVTLLCMASLGIDGFPREWAEYGEGTGFQGRNIIAGIGALIASIGALAILVDLIISSGSGASAGNDPWRAGTLEWFTQSPPPPNNFDVIPQVDSDAPLADLRERVAAGTGTFAGSVAQSPTSGRPSLRGAKH